MKKTMKNRLITSILAIYLLITYLPVQVLAAGEIFVNDGNTKLDMPITDAYAVAGDGTVDKVSGGKIYAITGNGLQEVGTTTAPPPSTGDGTVTPAPIGGTINLRTSTVKVGLYYYYSSARDSSLASATLYLQNGSGYKLGYYDANRNFYEVASTDSTAVTIIKDTNVTTAGGTIGCYHIKLNGTYNDFYSASTAAAAYSDGFPAYYNGSYSVLVGQYQSSSAAASALASRGLAGTVYTASNRCVVVTKSNTNKILFEYDGGTTSSLAVRPVASSGKSLTKLGNDTFYGDFEFIRTQGNNMTIVNYVNIEDYVKGVIPYEMSSSWPIEALKAQALCARTYAQSNFNTYKNYGFDLTDDTYSQVYRGTTSANSTTNAAVDQTSGQYVTYNGAFCSTLYFSSDGGATEDSENVFTAAYPYLRGIKDPFEASVVPPFTYQSWGGTYTPKELGALLTKNGNAMGEIVSVTPSYTRIGNMAKIVYRDVNGKTLEVTKSRCYTSIGYQSIHFTITKNSAGNYVIKGGGWGHNVGMSQWGAYAMAKYHGYSYAHILGFYYTGVRIATGV